MNDIDRCKISRVSYVKTIVVYHGWWLFDYYNMLQ